MIEDSYQAVGAISSGALLSEVEYTEFVATMPGGWYVMNGKSFRRRSQFWSSKVRPFTFASSVQIR